jgi:hypothetical protein
VAKTAKSLNTEKSEGLIGKSVKDRSSTRIKTGDGDRADPDPCQTSN